MMPRRIYLSDDEFRAIQRAIDDYAFLGGIGCGCSVYGPQDEVGPGINCEKCEKLSELLRKSIRKKFEIDATEPEETQWLDIDSPDAEYWTATSPRIAKRPNQSVLLPRVG